MIVLFDKNGNRICSIEKSKTPLLLEDSEDKKRRKYFLKTGERTGQGLCLNTKMDQEKKEMQFA